MSNIYSKNVTQWCRQGERVDGRELLSQKNLSILIDFSIGVVERVEAPTKSFELQREHG